MDRCATLSDNSTPAIRCPVSVILHTSLLLAVSVDRGTITWSAPLQEFGWAFRSSLCSEGSKQWVRCVYGAHAAIQEQV